MEKMAAQQLFTDFAVLVYDIPFTRNKSARTCARNIVSMNNYTVMNKFIQ